MKKRQALLLSILGILSIVLITLGVTYAFFNYTKKGSTENSITSGTITFLYTEVSKVGKGIEIRDAYPMSDELGKIQVGEGRVFDFKISSTVSVNADLPYEITIRKKSNSNLKEDVIKIYLTSVDGENEKQLLLDKFTNLDQTDMIEKTRYIEKTIYADIVPKNTSNYEKNFRLRMWVSNDVDFSNEEYQNKSFTITVNVYADSSINHNIYAKNVKHTNSATNCDNLECMLNELYEKFERRVD